MGQTAGQVEEKIADTRRRLAADLRDLQTKVDEVTNWRTHVTRNPMLWAGAAFAAGFVLSGPRRAPARVARAVGQAAGGADTLDHFVGAFTSLALERATAFIETRVPGFRQAFSQRSGSL